MKFIPPKIHGYLDIAVAIALFIAPSLFGFTSEASTLSYILGVAYVGIILLTAYPQGLIKAIPFTVHGAVELVLAPLLIASPWILGFSMHDPSRNFWVVAGIALFAVWLTTDYKAADIAYGKKGIDLKGKGRMRGAHA